MRTRSCFHAAAAALAFLTLTGFDAAGEDWRRVDYAEDGFSVEFSGEVQASPTPVEEASKNQIVRSTDYLQDNDHSAYIVAATLVRYNVEFGNGVEASYKALNCKATLSDAAPDFPGGQARSLAGADCGEDGTLSVEARYYTVGKWFYQVLAIYKKGDDPASALRFVGSFSLLNR